MGKHFVEDSSFGKFLIRTKLSDAYEQLFNENDDPLQALKLDLYNDPIYKAITDAYANSIEYKMIQKEKEERQRSLWQEAYDRVERGSVDDHVVVAYGAGTNGEYRSRSYHDTKTYCFIEIPSSIQVELKDGFLYFSAEGDAELHCLIGAFGGIAEILERQSKSELNNGHKSTEEPQSNHS